MFQRRAYFFTMRFFRLVPMLLVAIGCTAVVQRAHAQGGSGQFIEEAAQKRRALEAADLDGDGLNDLIVANNLRSKINLLYNETGKTNRPTSSLRNLEINELPPDARFRIASIPTDWFVQVNRNCHLARISDDVLCRDFGL